MVGVNSIGPIGMITIFGLSGLGMAAMKVQFDDIRMQEKQDKILRKYNLMETRKKEITTKLFNEKAYNRNETIKKEYEQMQVDQKENELNEYNMVECSCSSKFSYVGIKVTDRYALLLGHSKDGKPIWGYDTNYIFAGATGMGKTRKLYPIILNYLANRQGILYIGDLKGTDFLKFKDKRYVVKYVNELEHVTELIKAFESEYEARKELFEKSGCVDLKDYNKRTQAKMGLFMMVIDEYADIADCYKDRYGRPIGAYADLIRLARKSRSFGGRIILGTQRPTADVVSGSLKNNSNVIGLKCINRLNSQIMIAADGCERLCKTEGLAVLDGTLTKIFSYDIPNELLESYLNKLP